MSWKHRAFPILDQSGAVKTQLEEIAVDVLPRVQSLLASRCGGAWLHKPESPSQEGVGFSLAVGDTIEVPFTCLGRLVTSSQADAAADVVVHCPGLPGGLLLPLSALATCRGRLRGHSPSSNALTYAEQLGTLCCLEAVQKGWQKDTVLDQLYTVARRRHFSVVGTQELLTRAVQINQDALDPSFPYHCGGAQATKRYFDIHAEICSFFDPHATHGTRCLSRYGTAVSVGVSLDETSALPQIYWHPTGAMAACLAPVLSGCALLPVGEVKLPYNGPLRDSELLQTEDPRRYMRLPTEGDALDTTTWLCEGVFGVRPGEMWTGVPQQKQGDAPFSVVGVAFSAHAKEMELFLRNEKTGAVFVADDV